MKRDNYREQFKNRMVTRISFDARSKEVGKREMGKNQMVVAKLVQRSS